MLVVASWWTTSVSPRLVHLRGSAAAGRRTVGAVLRGAATVGARDGGVASLGGPWIDRRCHRPSPSGDPHRGGCTDGGRAVAGGGGVGVHGVGTVAGVALGAVVVGGGGDPARESGGRDAWSTPARSPAPITPLPRSRRCWVLPASKSSGPVRHCWPIRARAAASTRCSSPNRPACWCASRQTPARAAASWRCCGARISRAGCSPSSEACPTGCWGRPSRAGHAGSHSARPPQRMVHDHAASWRRALRPAGGRRLVRSHTIRRVRLTSSPRGR